MPVQKELVTRNEVREMGLNYSSTHFGRLEKAGFLTAVKVGGLRSSRVHYRLEQVNALIARASPSKLTARKAEALSGSRKDQKAKAASQKATGNHNWADRANDGNTHAERRLT